MVSDDLWNAAERHVRACDTCWEGSMQSAESGIVIPFKTMCSEGRALYDAYLTEVYK